MLTHPNWQDELSRRPTFTTNMDPVSVINSSLVNWSRANLITLEPIAMSEVKHETGICRKISPLSASEYKHVDYKDRLFSSNLPTMFTTIKPWSFWVVMMTGSSEYGSMTANPWKSPERRGTATDGQSIAKPRDESVNNPFSVTAM